MRHVFLFITTCAVLLTSCSHDEANISGMEAEMCTMPTRSGGIITYVVTDKNENLSFIQPATIAWAEKADTIYRALLYFRREGVNIVPVAAEQVLLLRPKTRQEMKNVPKADDPLTFVSGWYAKNGKYLNLTVDIKTGTPEDNGSHNIAMLCDTVKTSPTGKRYCYRMLHERNGVPEYYSVRVYFSVPAEDINAGDTVDVTIPTYDGEVQKQYIKR